MKHDNSLFQDYFNNNAEHYDEIENYLTVVIPRVCLRKILNQFFSSL